MVGRKKCVLLAAGFGGGVAVVMAAIVGGWAWYQGLPAKSKPWDAKAIVATFDYPDTESGEPVPPLPPGFKLDPERPGAPDTFVLYYTLENTTNIDYHMPPQEKLEVDGRLRRESSLSGNHGLVTLDKEHVFIPAKQRRRFGVHLNYPATESFGPDPKTKEERRKRWKLIGDYLKKEFSNLDGFVVFDSTNRYQINLPRGWDNTDLQ